MHKKVFFKRYIPLARALIFFVAGCAFSFALLSYFKKPEASKLDIPVGQRLPCDLMAVRTRGYRYIRPLLFVDQDCESPNLLPLKAAISRNIDSFKKSGGLTHASVYLRDLNRSLWMGLNDLEAYHPASLYKVPILIAYLRMAEQEPELLDKKVLFEGTKDKDMPTQNYVSASIELGKTYTIRDLLRYMIVHSDNKAEWLLGQNLDFKVMDHLFIDLGIGVPIPDVSDNQIRISARSYSAFMRTLFNSSYLLPAHSEFAMSLLGESQFKGGFAGGLPANTKIVHKFGEWDDNQNFEFHESGIIYISSNAYLLTIMTKGKNRDLLPTVVSSITKTIYEEMIPAPSGL